MKIDLIAVHVTTGPDDATRVSLYVRDPDGSERAFEVIRDHGTFVSHFAEEPALERCAADPARAVGRDL